MNASESSSDDDYSSLSDKLLDSLKESVFDFVPREFFPEGTIDCLIKRDDVRRKLSQAKKRYDDALVNYILSDAKKLFAIVTVVDSNPSWVLKAMKFLKSNDFLDSSISAEIASNGGTSFRERLAVLDPNFKIWSTGKRSKFFEQQWKAFAPVFSTARFNYDFELATILPFTEMERDVKKGAFSRIHKVSIHPCHYQDTDYVDKKPPTHFAIKEISPPDQDELERISESWGKEARTLKEMNMRRKKHILRFITAFTRGTSETPKSYYLMFEWADGGCLEDLWQQNQVPALRAELVKEAVEQLRGLAEALEATHNQANGVGVRHGDLKPENILRFQPTPKSIFGTLKIGDWGLAKYHNTATVLRGENTTTKYGTTLYEPPEVELGNVKILGRQYDIWSMGCIILELIIWLLYGYDNVMRFREEVKGESKNPVPCYRIVGGGNSNQHKAKIHEVVVRWMDHIADDPGCAAETAMGELLNLVRKHLLVVELPRMRAQTHYIEEWKPPVSQGSTMQPPQIAVTPSSRVDKPDLRRGQSLQAAHRTTSEGLMKYLDEQILDDEDRVEDFWLREVPTAFQRQGPPELLKISIQEESGLLKVPEGRTRQAPRDTNPVSEMGRLGIQNPKFVSIHAFASLPSTNGTNGTNEPKK